ncbi:hypothetical protein OA57_09020 [Chelonobacter oris]|uniref:GTP-binding protein n=1 Tax=Chelonobacter oris TaxID=505317 RepID=A0A0A3AKC8_9PAST|nr:YdgA family protein [Chelonobacter oris]KGQ69771.1 hypothetical protein OA57_09020 [Chelonobacter oris]
MKKSSLAIATIAVIAAAWAGGTWYSGKVLEEKYPLYIQQNNERNANFLLNGEYRLELKNAKLVRGFFTTELEDRLIITKLSDNTQYVIPFKSVAEHGPFPLSRLTSLRLAPVMTAAHSEISEDPSIADLFKASKGIPPIVSDFTISYSGQLKQHTTIAAFDYQDADITLNSTQAKIESDTNQKGIGLVKIALDKLNLNLATKGNALTLNKLNVHSDLTPTSWEFLPSGKQIITLESLDSQSANGEKKVELRNIKLDYNTALSGDFADFTFKNSVESVTFNQQPLGNIELNVALNHLKAETVNQMAEIAGKETNPDIVEQQLSSLGLTLLQNQPALHIQPFNLKNSAGENKLTFDVALSKEDPSVGLMQGKILSLFDQLTLNADISKPATEQLLLSVAQIGSSIPLSEQEITNLKFNLESELDKSVQQNILSTSDNQHYQSKLILENGELKLNGEVIPEKDIAQSLLMIIMGR